MAILLPLAGAFLLDSAYAGTPYIRSKTAYGRQYLYLQDVASYYGMTLLVNEANCEIRSRWNRVKFVFDKREGSINGYKMSFLFPVVKVNSIPLVSNADFQYVLEPLLRPYSIPKQTIRTIVIDPGHGGDDKGASGRKFREKDINLQIARRLRSILSARGYRVYLTRDRDIGVELGNRTNKCVSVGVDLFISVHCNSVGNREISGLETFALTPEGAPSTSDSKPKAGKERGNAFNKNNYSLCFNVHTRLITSTKANDRGVKHARYMVLKKAPCTAVLVECGFISNSYEETKLGRAEYQDKIASAIADGVTSYAKALVGAR